MPESTLSLIVQTIILTMSLTILIKSSDAVSDSSASLARITGLGELAIGFLMLSVTTSLPELAVSISAVVSQETGVSVGMLFGSNIANISLVLGLTAITASSAMMISKDSLRKLVLMMFPPTLVPIIILFSASAGSLVGLALLLIFGLFCIYSIKSKVSVDSIKDGTAVRNGFLKALVTVVVGVAVIMLSAHYVVDSATYLASSFGVDSLVIGATIIALGTSLPELSVSMAAVRKNYVDLALGNILGSCLTNLTLILGFTLVASSFVTSAAIFLELIVILSLVNFALWRMLLDSKIDFLDGLALLLLFLVFLASTLGTQLLILSPAYISPFLKSLAGISAKILSFAIVSAVALFLGRLLTRQFLR